jgi:hypothetical protein
VVGLQGRLLTVLLYVLQLYMLIIYGECKELMTDVVFVFAQTIGGRPNATDGR